jgi:hypothetical protein
MIIDAACVYRGCPCYIAEEGDGVEVTKKEWVALTNEEIDDLWKTEYFNLHYELARAIEAKLKEKNT